MTNRTYHTRGQTVDGFPVREHPSYNAWANMLSRCYNKNNNSWADYGGRGISVDPEWHHFVNFARDMGIKQDPDLSIDRKQNHLGYSATNCHWATSTEQCHNRRLFKNNTTGAQGVVKIVVRLTRFAARFDHKGHRYEIGRFSTVDEAANARSAFEGLFFVDQPAAMEMMERETTWCTSSTGVRGVAPHVDGGFTARTTENKKRIYLGYFKTVSEAQDAIQKHKGLYV